MQFVERNLDAQFSPRRGLPVIVALSGGADSVALLVALTRTGARCIAAHCNFHLRGAESDRDARHAEAVTRRFGAEFLCRDFDVGAQRRLTGESVEMACRTLRYDWFRELSVQYGGADVAVAHHSDDNIETLLLNMLRGTGLNGLTGMSRRAGHIIRPMLEVSRADVERFLRKNGVDYVTDSSNMVNDVKRNKLRNVILPTLRREFPDSRTGLLHTIENLGRNRALYNLGVRTLAERYTGPGGWIDLGRLADETGGEAATLLFEMIRDKRFNFSQCSDMVRSSRTSGQSFHAPGVRAVIDRGRLLFAPDAVGAAMMSGLSEAGIKAEIVTAADMVPDRSGATAYFDADLIDSPLMVRGWERGDRIRPFGMNGSRLVSDLLSDAKLSVIEKERVRLVVSGTRVLWVVGLRASAHYPVSGSTRRVLRLSVIG